ncbi:MAG: FHA domain-containing protein [Acidimicrobiales bacterium]|nr:FHA domain-containing protein [Acidimicrobiales bacterium]
MGTRGFERRIEQLVEGTFARVFRSGLRPVELGRRLVREMDANRSVGVHGELVAPNHFTVRLGPADHRQFAEVAESLRRELADAAREHARDENYRFLGPVGVELVVDPRFKSGSFRIDARLKEAEGGHGPGSLLLPTGDRVPLGEQVILIGRLDDCTIQLGDPNVSRHHAEIRPIGLGFRVVDLGSTNGTTVGGHRVTEHDLSDGDEIVFGTTVIRFEAS